MAPTPYFLLSEVAPGDRIGDLLGRAILIENKESLKRPLEGEVIPRLPTAGPNLQALEPGLYPTHIKAEDASTLSRRASTEAARLVITRALNLFYKHDKNINLETSTASFRRITMETQREHIKSLLVNNEEYRSPILELFKKHPKSRLGVIVSIISCYEMQVNQHDSKKHEAGADISAPSELTGTPAEAAIKTEINREKTVETRGSYKDEVIVACGYLEMTLREPSRSWAFWRSSELSHEDIVIPGDPIHPLTMTVTVPSTRMHGDQEAILGGMQAGGSFESLESQDLDFVLYEETCEVSR